VWLLAALDLRDQESACPQSDSPLNAMLAIVTAFKSQLLTKDWDYHVWLLERSLDSMLAQTNESFIVVVVCHEIPSTSYVEIPKVRFLPVDFPPPQRNNDDMCVDKVLKLSVGAEWAIAEGYDYVMFTDADDLISWRISEFVALHHGANGWYAPSEFFYTYGSYCLLKNNQTPMTGGPSVIVRADRLKFASVPFNGIWLKFIIEGGEQKYAELLAVRNRRTNTLAAAGHAYFQRLMTAEGHPLERLPFPAYVMINHADSTSQVKGGLGSATPPRLMSSFRRMISNLPSVRPLTHALRCEFAIPAPSMVPVAYKSSGSMFDRL
jgi:hypothetical protein